MSSSFDYVTKSLLRMHIVHMFQNIMLTALCFETLEYM